MKRFTGVAVADQSNSNRFSIFKHKNILSTQATLATLNEKETTNLNSVDCDIVLPDKSALPTRSQLDVCRTSYSSQVLPGFLAFRT